MEPHLPSHHGRLGRDFNILITVLFMEHKCKNHLIVSNKVLKNMT